MNAQTKKVAKAALLGLVIATIVTAVNIAANGLEPWSLDEMGIFNPEVIAHWVGRVGFLPVLFVLIATATSFRKFGVGLSALSTL
jgi:hypothetical protein